MTLERDADGMIRIAVIGASAHSRRHHGPALQDCARTDDDVDLAAVCDLDHEAARRYAAEFDFERTYDDADEMLASESLDALVVVTPPAVTATLVADLLPLGIPLLVEKPPGRTVEDARRLESVAERHDAPHAVSFNRRFHPAVGHAREWLRANAADRPPGHAVALLYRHDRTEPTFLTYTGIHAVDTVRSFMPPVETASSRRWQSHPSGSTSCAARVVFDGGAEAQLVLAPDAGCDEETYELIGPGYTVRIDTVDDSLEICDRGELVACWNPATRLPTRVRTGATNETRAFLAAVRGEREFSPTLTDGVVAFEIAEELARSVTDAAVGRDE